MTFKLDAQCSGGGSGGALTPAPAAGYQTATVAAGQYYTINVAAGCMPTYTFTFCSNGGSASFDTQITILDNSGTYAGGYNDDFCGLQSQATWTPSAAGTYRVLITNYPCSSSGATATLAYNMATPPNMTFTSCTTVQSSSAGVTKCDLDQDVISVQVVTSGSCNALTLTQFQLGAGGSSSGTLADVSKIHIYYTGTTNTFNSTNEFVSGGTTPAGGSNTIPGSQTLASGTNYFWIAYDINPAATAGNVVDASCTQITLSTGAQVPTATNPAGTRLIAACSSYPGTSALGLKNWEKSDAGITLTGGAVSSWADQSGAAITGNMNQGTAANRPTVQSGIINYQDYIRFDGSNDILVSANTFTGPTLFGNTDNTILIVKNLKAGLVDYKWETDPTNSWRVGMELSGTHQRFDFVDDNAGGKNDASTTNITNKDVIVVGVTDASSIALRLNGNADASMSNPGLNMSGALVSKPLNIGANDLGNPLYCQVDIAEVITYNKKLSVSEMRRAESYLAIKYGITLGNNKGAGACVLYMESDGTQIWSGQTGYHNYVIGLGRDNAAGNSGLSKIKTTSVSSLNASTDIIALANSNFAAPVAFTNDKAFLMIGSNAGSLATPIPGIFNHGGPVTAIAVKSSRVWATEKTGTHTGNLIVEVNMALMNGPSGYGTNTNTDIRLLVDNDAVFNNASAGEHTYSPTAGFSATGGKIYFSVPYSDIQAGTGYFTIGSVNASTAPLPIQLVDFSASCDKNKIDVKWTTSSEINNDYFSIERSIDGIVFKSLANIDGSGNSSQTNSYVWTDDQSIQGSSYYRLRQTDFDGKTKTFNTIEVDCMNENTELVITNAYQSNERLELDFSSPLNGVHQIKILDEFGNVIFSRSKFYSAGKNSEIFDVGKFSSGIYFISLQNAADVKSKKLLIIK